MKSFKKAFFSNKEYHHNLLGADFASLVAEATEITLLQPNPEATQNVIVAINDPNTGMELSPQHICGELRRHMKSNSSQKQWLALCLVQEILKECEAQVQPVLMEILEMVSGMAIMQQASAKRTQQKALEILRSYGNVANEAFRNGSGLRRIVTPTDTLTDQSDPEKSVELIRHYEPIARQHCEVLRGLIQEKEMREGELVLELLAEVEEMKKSMIGLVQRISVYSGEEVEDAVIRGVGVVDMTGELLETYEELKNAPEEPLQADLLSMRSLSSPSLGQQAPTIRRPSTDLLTFDSLDPPQSTMEDPFQELANEPVLDSQDDQPTQSSIQNPFRDLTM